jgi:hypothetical protein
MKKKGTIKALVRNYTLERSGRSFEELYDFFLKKNFIVLALNRR